MSGNSGEQLLKMIVKVVYFLTVGIFKAIFKTIKHFSEKKKQSQDS